MKPVEFSQHALDQCREREATRVEVMDAIEPGDREPAKHGRVKCRLTFPFEDEWRGKRYRFRQVAPIIVDEPHRVLVVTVYVHLF